ncbi:MAG: SpoIVB peptidase, partial [Clostridia bacterium]|nr:SpoIVB peptidase [Clostridia bacterium]
FDTRTGTYKLGLWVREDTAGVGTLSYYNPKTQTFGALGHPVTDIDTGDIFTVENGNICECRIIDITPGKSGTPGELTGMFSQNSTVLGNIYKNTEFGIFGSISPASQLSFLYPDGVRLAYPDEVHTGDASIICTLDDNIAREYSCRLVKCKKQDSPAIKGLVVEITDSELINKTGGIVQGMSGSPIIQDGKLAGVVTHVMINNPLRGYGMYAYWMYSVGESRNK